MEVTSCDRAKAQPKPPAPAERPDANRRNGCGLAVSASFCYQIPMFKPCCFLGGLILALCLTVSSVHAQPTITNVNVGTAFRYQGAVRGVFPNSVSPSGAQNGTLQFQFGLWDDPVNTNATSQMASNIFMTLNVSNGFFSTMLDFGDVFDGRRAFLEVAVYAPSNTIPASSNWIIVSPRTEIGAVPYALWALKGGREVLRSEGVRTLAWWYNASDIMADGSTFVPGGFVSVFPSSGPNSTNMANFEIRSAPRIVEEARVMIGQKSWFQPPPCLSCYVTVTLEVWRLTNSVVSNAGGAINGDTYGVKSEFVRTISVPTNLVLGTVSVGGWISLPLTNSASFRRVNSGERLRLVSRGGGGTPSSYHYISLTAEAIVRDAP